MTVKIIRFIFVVACMVMGVMWARQIVAGTMSLDSKEAMAWEGVGAIVGFGISMAIFGLLRLVTQELFEKLVPALILIVLSMVMGYFAARYIMLFFTPEDLTIHLFTTTSLVLLFGYVGISLGLTRTSSWEALVSAVRTRESGFRNPKVVDTSVIIDGRIADICDTGFIEGTLIVPRFVLKELQAIADSSDVLRRAKGRRGLDILKSMQGNHQKTKVEVIEDNPLDTRDVDEKLVVVARKLGAKIVTNDFNLNKVAQIEGVEVLNINDLANALKPAVLPDEHIEVKIIKEGKEAFQGVGYLDDGTMVVVDGGKEYVGKHITAVVTSVLQTAAGRMIFTKLSGIVS